MKANFTNFKYETLASSLEGHHEVCVTFKYQDKAVKRFIFVKDKEGANANYYISEAKKRIESDISNGKLAKYAKRYGPRHISTANHANRFLLTFGIIMSAAALTFAGLFTYKYFTDPGTGGGGGGGETTYDVTIGLTQEMEGYSIKVGDEHAYPKKAYSTTITLTEPSDAAYHLPTDEASVNVKINNVDITVDDFVYTHTAGAKTADFKIPDGTKINGKVEITVKLEKETPGDTVKVKLDTDSEKYVKITGPTEATKGKAFQTKIELLEEFSTIRINTNKSKVSPLTGGFKFETTDDGMTCILKIDEGYIASDLTITIATMRPVTGATFRLSDSSSPDCDLKHGGVSLRDKPYVLTTFETKVVFDCELDDEQHFMLDDSSFTITIEGGGEEAITKKYEAGPNTLTLAGNFSLTATYVISMNPSPCLMFNAIAPNITKDGDTIVRSEDGTYITEDPTQLKIKLDDEKEFYSITVTCIGDNALDPAGCRIQATKEALAPQQLSDAAFDATRTRGQDLNKSGTFYININELKSLADNYDTLNLDIASGIVSKVVINNMQAQVEPSTTISGTLIYCQGNTVSPGQSFTAFSTMAQDYPNNNSLQFRLEFKNGVDLERVEASSGVTPAPIADVTCKNIGDSTYIVTCTNQISQTFDNFSLTIYTIEMPTNYVMLDNDSLKYAHFNGNKNYSAITLDSTEISVSLDPAMQYKETEFGVQIIECNSGNATITNAIDDLSTGKSKLKFTFNSIPETAQITIKLLHPVGNEAKLTLDSESKSYAELCETMGGPSVSDIAIAYDKDTGVATCKYVTLLGSTADPTKWKFSINGFPAYAAKLNTNSITAILTISSLPTNWAGYNLELHVEPKEDKRVIDVEVGGITNAEIKDSSGNTLTKDTKYNIEVIDGKIDFLCSVTDKSKYYFDDSKEGGSFDFDKTLDFYFTPATQGDKTEGTLTVAIPGDIDIFQVSFTAKTKTVVNIGTSITADAAEKSTVKCIDAGKVTELSTTPTNIPYTVGEPAYFTIEANEGFAVSDCQATATPENGNKDIPLPIYLCDINTWYIDFNISEPITSIVINPALVSNSPATQTTIDPNNVVSECTSQTGEIIITDSSQPKEYNVCSATGACTFLLKTNEKDIMCSIETESGATAGTEDSPINISSHNKSGYKFNIKIVIKDQYVGSGEKIIIKFLVPTK